MIMIKETIPLNLVPISGMQGSGKDTLIEDLLNTTISSEERMMPFEIVRSLNAEMTSFEDIIENPVSRIAKYVIDWRRAVKMAKDHPNHMIITDGCYHDANCHLMAFQVLDWITNKQYDWLYDILEESFRLWNIDQIKPFFLNPSLAFIQRNLQKRNRDVKGRWYESDPDYIESVFTSYNYYFSKDDAHGVIGFTNANKVLPAYEYTGIDRTKRVVALMTCLKRRWKIYKGEATLPYDEEDPRRWLMTIHPKG